MFQHHTHLGRTNINVAVVLAHEDDAVLVDSPSMGQVGPGTHLSDMGRRNTTQITTRNKHHHHLPITRLKTMAATMEVEKIKATLAVIDRPMLR